MMWEIVNAISYVTLLSVCSVASDGPDDSSRVYEITYKDIAGKDVHIVANRSWVQGSDDIQISSRIREDSYNVTSPAAYPYSVLILQMQGIYLMSICTGSILTAEWVLSAAHCVPMGDKGVSLAVYAGGNSLDELLKQGPAEGSQTSKTTVYYSHPAYRNSVDADVSVIKVGPFRMTETVNTIPLSVEPWRYYSYKLCTITGFGRVQIDSESPDDRSRKTQMLMVKKPCLCSFRFRMMMGRDTVRRLICSKPTTDYGLCPGDSGGGLICDGTLKGVVIQLFTMDNMGMCDPEAYWTKIKCGSKESLTVFEDVCPFARWINSYTQMLNDSEISPECVYTGGTTTSNPIYVMLLLMFARTYYLL